MTAIGFLLLAVFLPTLFFAVSADSETAGIIGIF